MSNCNCGTGIGCSLLAVIAGIILGIVAAILRYTAIITLTSAFLWVTFGIGIVYLAVLLVSPSLKNITPSTCVCNAVKVVLLGILGTVLASIILLAISFTTTSVVGTILTGLLLLSLTFTIAGSACLVKCITGCEDN